MLRAAMYALVLAVLPYGTAGAEESAQSPDARTREALVTALEDERMAQSLYGAIMERHGRVRPFVNIIEAEKRHEQALLVLLDRYGVPVPPRREHEVAVPDTLAAACAAGVEGEKRNIAMYDRFLAFVKEPDIRRVFSRLQSASRNRHLPAFERCVRRAARRPGR